MCVCVRVLKSVFKSVVTSTCQIKGDMSGRKCWGTTLSVCLLLIFHITCIGLFFPTKLLTRLDLAEIPNLLLLILMKTLKQMFPFAAFSSGVVTVKMNKLHLVFSGFLVFSFFNY